MTDKYDTPWFQVDDGLAQLESVIDDLYCEAQDKVAILMEQQPSADAYNRATWEDQLQQAELNMDMLEEAQSHLHAAMSAFDSAYDIVTHEVVL